MKKHKYKFNLKTLIGSVCHHQFYINWSSVLGGGGFTIYISSSKIKILWFARAGRLQSITGAILYIFTQHKQETRQIE